MKATKTWRDMLSKSLSDPNFRKEWEEANAELAELTNSSRLVHRLGLRRLTLLPTWERRSQQWRDLKVI